MSFLFDGGLVLFIQLSLIQFLELLGEYVIECQQILRISLRQERGPEALIEILTNLLNIADDFDSMDLVFQCYLSKVSVADLHRFVSREQRPCVIPTLLDVMGLEPL